MRCYNTGKNDNIGFVQRWWLQSILWKIYTKKQEQIKVFTAKICCIKSIKCCLVQWCPNFSVWGLNNKTKPNHNQYFGADAALFLLPLYHLQTTLAWEKSRYRTDSMGSAYTWLPSAIGAEGMLCRGEWLSVLSPTGIWTTGNQCQLVQIKASCRLVLTQRIRELLVLSFSLISSLLCCSQWLCGV